MRTNIGVAECDDCGEVWVGQGALLASLEHTEDTGHTTLARTGQAEVAPADEVASPPPRWWRRSR